MVNGLIATIGAQLNIPYTANTERICQIVYSIAGKMALASLWDRDEECEEGAQSVSIQHFKDRIAQIFDAYAAVSPNTRFMIPKDRSVLLDEIYSIYLRGGFMYHRSHQISPAAPAAASFGNTVLHRGESPDAELYMSGLGFYSMKGSSGDRSIASMFGLQEQSFDQYLDELLQCSEWEPIDWPEDAEYLRLDPPFKRGYWLQEPNADGRISLARYGEPGKIYVFYRYDNKQFQQKTIPEWRIRDYFSNDAGYGEYRRIAISLLSRYGTLPEITVKSAEDQMEIKLGYLLPPSEEDFFKLYSWPLWPLRDDFSAKESSVFTRKMAKQIYPIFKHELESIGYCFVEE